MIRDCVVKSQHNDINLMLRCMLIFHSGSVCHCKIFIDWFSRTSETSEVFAVRSSVMAAAKCIIS